MTAPMPPAATRPAAMLAVYPAFLRMGHMMGATDMVVATPLACGPPRRAVVTRAPRPALAWERPMVASDKSSQKLPAPAASMKVP